MAGGKEKVMVKGTFGKSGKELSDLVSASSEKPRMLAEIGGAATLAKNIGVNMERGLSGAVEDMEERRTHFGKNFVDGKPPKTFIQLCLAALNDFTLIMLVVCAVISLVLGVTIEVRYTKVYHSWRIPS